jgi:PHD/YefM family antitoxin component YafN of YafNO toxin-antitoxin module
MTTATVEQVKSRFDRFIKASKSGPVVVTRKGKPVAMLLGSKNADDIERLMMAYSPKLRAILDRSSAQLEAGEGIPADRFWSELAATPTGAAKRPRKTPRRK